MELTFGLARIYKTDKKGLTMISRRQFMISSGLLFLASHSLSIKAQTKAKKLKIATWPEYHSQENLAQFTKQTGIEIELQIFGSNEEMLAQIIYGIADFDVMVATNYTIDIYAQLGLIHNLDINDFPYYDQKEQNSRMNQQGIVNDIVYGLPKNWGTTGFVYDQSKISSTPTSWEDFWYLARTEASTKCVVHDYQLTAVGNALKHFSYSLNSTTPQELNHARDLLLRTKPHLKAISSLGAAHMRDGAILSMAWTGDGLLLSKENPDIRYVIAEEGGEIWCDYFTIPIHTPHVKEAKQFINFLLNPDNNVNEVAAHGFPPIDNRTLTLLPDELLSNSIMFPTEDLLKNLEFGASTTITDPLRTEILNTFKSV